MKIYLNLKEDKNEEDCPPGKMVSPKTGNCINEKKKKPTTCPPGKMVSPKTGKCINERRKNLPRALWENDKFKNRETVSMKRRKNLPRALLGKW